MLVLQEWLIEGKGTSLKEVAAATTRAVKTEDGRDNRWLRHT
jgi:hypothetical protein